VIAAALEILASKGSDALALREVARRVGVSHRAIYRHYADKTALLAAIAEQGFLRLADAVEARLEQLDHGLSQRPRPAEPAWVDTEMRLVAIGEAYVTLALERPADFQVMFGPRLNEDGRFPALEAAIERVLRPLLATIDDGIAAGALTAAERGDHMIAMWSLLHGFGTLVLFGRVRVRPELVQPYLRRIVSLSLRGVLRAPR
jgi:AcrR family transcriptional regulator